MKTILALFILLLGTQAHALDYGCQLKPDQINDVGTRMVKAYADKKQSVPDSLVITADFETVIGEDKPYAMGTLEGFYRPKDDDFYSLIPIPVLGISLSRTRNMVYLCAHYDADPAKTHVTVYMLRGFHLDPTSVSTAIGNFANAPSLKIRPLTAAHATECHDAILYEASTPNWACRSWANPSSTASSWLAERPSRL